MLRACYSGYQRGLLAEAFNLLGLVSATALASNFQPILSRWALPWWRFNPAIAQFTIFLTLLLLGLILFGVLVRMLARLVTWKMSWIAQLIGLVLGAVRGAWVAGLLVLIALASGWAYADRSITQRSWVGPMLAQQMRAGLEQVRGWYPGDRMSGPAVPSLPPPNTAHTWRRLAEPSRDGVDS